MKKCRLCGSNASLSYVDDHKKLLPEDTDYFDHLKLYSCCSCGSTVAEPVPDESTLNRYYSEVYRQPGKPHYIANPELIEVPNWQKAQVSCISQFLNVDRCKSVADFGPGYGFLLREIRNQNQSASLFAIDPDKDSLAYLSNYAIDIVDQVPKNSQFDLIVSSHSLEHMTDPRSFMQYVNNLLDPNGIFFLEVPNCSIDGGYLDRPYDGSHLNFFTLSSLEKLAISCGFHVKYISTAGRRWAEAKILMDQQHKSVSGGTSRSKGQRLKALLRRWPIVFRTAKILLGKTEAYDFSDFHYGGDRWSIRAVLSKRSS